MKNYLSIIGLFIVFVIVVSCNSDRYSDGADTNKSIEFYRNYFKTQSLKKGVVETEFFKIKWTDDSWLNGLSHTEIISAIDKMVETLAEYRAKSLKEEIEEVKLLIEVVKEHNLVEKEDFYKKLVSIDSDVDKLIYYQKELSKKIELLPKIDLPNGLKDKKALELYNNYDYLVIVAKNSNGDYIQNYKVDKYDKKDIQYSIAKYDKQFKKDGFYKSKRGINNPNTALVKNQ